MENVGAPVSNQLFCLHILSSKIK